jgi:hypothetical protein
MEKFLSLHSSFFLRTRRIRGKYLSAYGECVESIQAHSETTQKVFKRIWRIWQYGVICGTQNRLRMRGKYLNTFGEYAERSYASMEKTQRDSLCAKRYKSVYISFNNNTNLNLFKILSNYIIWDRLSQKTNSRYCPFKSLVSRADFYLPPGWNCFNVCLDWQYSQFINIVGQRRHSVRLALSPWEVACYARASALTQRDRLSPPLTLLPLTVILL